MRRFAIAVGIVLAVVIVGVAVFAATFDVNRYRGTIQSQIEQRLVRKVTLGEMRLKLLPPRFTVENLTIADNPAFATEKPFVQAQQLDVTVRLFALLRGNVQIDSLELQRPSVELIKNEQGIWNFSSLGSSSASSNPLATPSSPNGPPQTSSPTGQPTQPDRPSEGRSRRQLSLARLAISDGQVGVTDRQHGLPRALYDHIDATVLDFASNEPFSIDIVAHLPGAGTQQVRVQGQVGPIVSGQLATTPFHGTLGMQQVGVAGLQKFLDSPALANTDGVLSGQAQVGNDSGRFTATGQINVQNAKVRGLELGYPIAMAYDVTDDLTADMLTLRDTTIKLGTMPILVRGTVDMKPTPAQINVDVKVNTVSITDAAKLAAASGLAFSPGATIVGNVSAEIKAQGAADNPALSGTLSGRDVQISGKEIPQPVYTKSINLSFTPSEIQTDNFNVTSGGTTISAQITLRDYQSKTPFVDASLRAPNAALAEVLTMAKAYGVTGLESIKGAGTVNVDLRATGLIQGTTSASKLAFSGTVAGRDIQISGKDVPQPIQVKAVNLTLTPSEIHSDNFNLSTGGTTLAAHFVVRQYLAKTPLLDATLRAPNAALPEVLALAKAYGVTALEKISGAGTLNMDLHAAGPVQEITSAEIMKALNGTLNLNLNSVRYSGTDLAYQLASIGGFLKSSEGDKGFTDISRVTGDIAVKNGIAQSNNVLAVLDIGNVGITGTANLATDALSLRLTAVMSKEFSQRVGGSEISGYLNTALANNQGELVIPVIVTGTFQNPKYAPDLEKVAQMKLKGLVPNADNPLGTVTGILGGLLGKKGETQSQPGQQQPAQPNPVQELIDIFGHKSKQENPHPSQPPK